MITHDRWQLLKEIFQSAQEKTPTERIDFLDEVCGDDKSIREEVEALLTADESNDDFLSKPAYEFAASILTDEEHESEFKAGQKVGRYTILCSLGAGGMGQIYLAHDEQLGRKIALKLIATEFATDPRRVLRFEQEARAASVLNHPNVCVIHETGVTENDRHFIAMEYIQGNTLRDKLTSEPIAPLEALHIARQVADALAAAHAACIVHRDIKPENIMLRPDGYVKVLDFGLAKLTELLPEPDGTHQVSSTVRTEAGTLMGTVKYMSPEQLQETELDERTDIWSLGVVLYEMLTGTTPFEARTPNDTIALILGPQPPALWFPDELPARFREIVKKALEKDRAIRYQTVTKLASDLAALQKELERETEISSTPRRRRSSGYLPFSGQKTQSFTAGSAIFTRLKSQALQTADFLFTEIKSHKAATLAGMTLVLALLLFLPNVIKKFVGPASEMPQISVFTNAGTSVCSAITNDGTLIAHAEEQDGKQRLMLTSTVTYITTAIVPPDEVRYLGITFSRDNLFLYFTRKDKDGTRNLYRLPVQGGAPLKVKEDVDSPVSFSPARDRFAFVRLNRANSEYLLIVSDIGGTNERVLATRTDGDTFSTYGQSWSPDGNMIVCPAGHWSQGYHVELLAFDLKDGASRKIGDGSWFSVYQVAWQDDMSGLVFSARQGEATPHQLWRTSYPAGEIQRITFDLNEYLGVSLAGDKIVTLRQDRSWHLWVAALDDFQSARSITSGVGLNYGVSWTANGKMVFSSMVQDRLNISRVDPDGSNQVQLTRDGDNYHPAASADGRLIVFASTRNGSYNIWSMNADDGSDPKQLTFTDGNFYPSVSPDNQWVAYDNQTETKLSIWKVPLQGGTAVKVVDRYRMPVFSPDGKLFAARYDAESGSKGLVIFSAEGGEPVQTVPVPDQDWQRVYWLDGHTLSFVKNTSGHSNIWSYDLNTRTEKQLTYFIGEQIYAYAWSPDFKQVVCQRGRKTSDVVIISSER